ncbi:hypothetical protein E0E54_00750 [Azotobacter chroococcum]|uniref:hypothetical protein n=1 Tax=Azotobacter chroococcum TaxID=353 RepID=UPI00103BF0E2|nr:hypothetical protein [Azotobacter chroococcum]TBW40139.1 hypothetical protein E0E54_00750 [Azotobacter chroococcum]
MLTADIGAGWRRARASGDPVTATPWSRTPARNRALAGAWQPGQPRERDSAAPWSAIPARDPSGRLPWGEAPPAEARSASAWNAVPPRDHAAAGGWDSSIRPREVRLRLLYNPQPARKDLGTAQAFQRCDEFGPRYDAAEALRRSVYLPGTLPLAFDFAGARYSPGTTPEVFFDFVYIAPTRAIQPVDSGSADRWQSARRLDLRRALRWGPGQSKDPAGVGIAYPDYDGPVIAIEPAVEPDLLETYMIANSVQLVVLPERTPLDATGLSVSRDIDAFAWHFSAQLLGRTSLNLVRPDAGGPKTVELTINGHVWVFLIERYSSQGKFPAERFTIGGVSRTQLLAEPYAPKRSAVNAVDINAQQAAADQLTDTGFTLSWDSANQYPPDWTIAAGAFSYQEQTPMQVIARVAEAIGAVVKPARDSDALSVIPRYRAAPWAWAGEVMERIIPAEIVGEWGSEWSPQPEWNSCYVSGTSHGVAVDVRRTGTAGDKPAPDVYDDLITGTDAARSRGIAELAKGGNQEIVTLDLPLFPEATAPGLIEPAMLCEVRDIDGTWRGLCLATEIGAEGVGAARVTQTVRLERHH